MFNTQSMEKHSLSPLNVSQYNNYPVNGHNIYRFNGKDTFFGFVANCINGFWFGDKFWHSLRKAKKQEPEKYKAMKSVLPAYTLSGEYSGRRKKENLIVYNRLICIDIDPGDNPQILNWTALRDEFFEAWQEVVLSALSASGEGVFMVFALQKQNAETFEQHEVNHKRFFAGIERAFAKYGIKLDGSCKDIARLRYATFDPDLKYRAIIKKELALPREPRKTAIMPPKFTKQTKGVYEPLKHAVNAANKRWGEFGEGNKHNWINTCTFVMKENGVPEPEREQFIINNFLDKSQIKTNCLQ